MEFTVVRYSDYDLTYKDNVRCYDCKQSFSKKEIFVAISGNYNYVVMCEHDMIGLLQDNVNKHCVGTQLDVAIALRKHGMTLPI